MQIVRSAIGTAEKQQKIKEQYGDFLPGIICLFEYRVCRQHITGNDLCVTP